MPSYLVAVDWMEGVILTIPSIDYEGLNEEDLNAVDLTKAVVIHCEEPFLLFKFRNMPN